MEPVSEALRLLKRQADLQRRQGTSILAEREIYAIQARLEHFPAAVRAIAELTGAQHRSLDQIRVEDVERWDTRG